MEDPGRPMSGAISFDLDDRFPRSQLSAPSSSLLALCVRPHSPARQRVGEQP